MADDTSPDVSADNDIDDMPLFATEPTEAAPEAPGTPAEESTDDAAATEDTKEEAPVEAKDTEATEESTETTQTDDTGKGKPDPEIARQRYLERQQARSHVAQQIDQVYGPKTEEQLVDEGLSPEQAQIQALREEMQFERQRNQIADLNATLQVEAVNVEADYGVYNPKSPDYDPDFTAMVERQYQVAARLQMDENQIITNAEVPLYDFYKSMADIYTAAQSKGSQQAQQETLQTLSRTEAVGSSSGAVKHNETLEEMGERLRDLPII